MKKNFDKNFEVLKIDPITGNYYITIPEWMVNDLSWYEDTEIEIKMYGNEVILKEKN